MREISNAYKTLIGNLQGSRKTQYDAIDWSVRSVHKSQNSVVLLKSASREDLV